MSDSTTIYNPSDERIPIGTQVRSCLKVRDYYGRVIRHSVECKGYPNIVRWQGNIGDEACSINELEIVGE